MRHIPLAGALRVPGRNGPGLTTVRRRRRTSARALRRPGARSQDGPRAQGPRLAAGPSVGFRAGLSASGRRWGSVTTTKAVALGLAIATGIAMLSLSPAFAQSPPTVTAVIASSGPTAGGQQVTVEGTNLASPSAVHFGAAGGDHHGQHGQHGDGDRTGRDRRDRGRDRHHGRRHERHPRRLTITPSGANLSPM
jgi:hypothetical protein